jgi:hypothetical protein
MDHLVPRITAPGALRMAARIGGLCRAVSGADGAVTKFENAGCMLEPLGAGNSMCLDYLPGIVAALRSDVEGDYLQSISELIHADVFSEFLGMAEHLLDEGYKEAAAVLIGGVLEEHLRKLASKNGIAVVAGPRPVRADRLNADLANATVYSRLYQKNVTAWLDLRNKAAHGKHDEYPKEQGTDAPVGAGLYSAICCVTIQGVTSGKRSLGRLRWPCPEPERNLAPLPEGHLNPR